MPPRSNTTCWRCRHDRQACVRDPYDPETCSRCQQLRYTCALAKPPPDEREGRILKFLKCDQCRRAHQRCSPSDDPERCTRCVEKKLPCSPLTNTKKMPRKPRPGDGPGGSGGHSDSRGPDSDYTESESPEQYDEEDQSYPADYTHNSNQYHYPVYSEQYGSYGNYANYNPNTYDPAMYGQSEGYNQPEYSYNCNGY
ncbi:hypothetical protein ABW20_dc0104333 [Dactylellina cionopaga]|nr:hypothetical protein ABW20_dc0104333 [Dactylellina cionopaga]